jgi:hypothetical protein
MLELLNVAIGFATVMLAVSLIIMSLTQAVSSLLALRGTQLRRGLQQLLEQTAPSLKEHSKQLSEAVVKHPLISDSATVLGGRWKWAAAIKKEELLPVLDAALAQLGKPALSVEAEREALEKWFDSFMSRVSQWFVMNTRWVTVAFALVLAFTLHLDSAAVFKQLTEDSETRSKLAAMSASLLEQSPSATETVEGHYTEALKELVRGNAAKFNDGVTESSVEPVGKRADAVIWIGTNAKPPEKDGLVKTYNGTVDKKLTASIDKSIDRAKTLQGSLASAGIVLPPPGHTYKDWLDPTSSHVLGMLASVLFLSLGAPFWFNLLKNLTSLKSAVTTKPETASEPGGRARGLVVAPTTPPTLPALPKVGAKAALPSPV